MTRRAKPAASKRRSQSKFSGNQYRAGKRVQSPVSELIGVECELKITGFSQDGRGIARRDGMAVFVEAALPGEQVNVKIISQHSRYLEAEVKTIMSASPERGEPVCEYYGRCGGCNLQHLQYQPAEKSIELSQGEFQGQLVLKQAAVLDQFQRSLGELPARVLPVLGSTPYGYRQRARLAIWYRENGEFELGFRQSKSKKLVDVTLCSVLDTRLNALLPRLREWLQDFTCYRAVTHIELLSADSDVGIVIRHTQALEATALKGLMKLSLELHCQIWLKPEREDALVDVGGQSCDPRMSYTLPDYKLKLYFHPLDFTQVNAAINRAMIQQAITLMQLQGHERVLDLFCGIGNFTLPIARLAREVVGVEGVESMVLRGRENAVLNQIENVQFIAADLEKDVAKMHWARESFDVVLLDPPRAGAKGVMHWLQQLAAERIVYVSCDPATLIRDSKMLLGMGYQLTTLGFMDMFPQTAHIESMVLFERCRSKVSRKSKISSASSKPRK